MVLQATMTRDWPPTWGVPGVGGFYRRFAETCERWPHRVALVDGDRRLTFGEWSTLASHFAAVMRAKGIEPGDVVAFQLPNWWETAVVFVATAQLGAVANPLLPIFREREIGFMLRQSGARILFVPQRFRGFDYPAMVDRVAARTTLEDVIVVRAADGPTLFDSLSVRKEPVAEWNPSVHELLMLMYTSGTTAEPKGVLHSHASLLAEVSSLARVHDLGVDDVTLMPSPLTHISGVLHGIIAPAVLATRAILMERWQPEHALDLIERHSVSYMVGAPVFLRGLVEARGDGGAPNSCLRLFSCGGADVPPELMRQARRVLGCSAKRVYGSTEFPTISTTSEADVDAFGISTDGRPIDPNQVRIVKSDGSADRTPLAVGTEGEVQALGPECFVGYVDASLNDDAFTEDGWFRTGDLGVLDEDGYLKITGRLKEIIIRKGEKISIREVEEAICLHPSVREACMVGIPDAEVGERGCVVVVVVDQRSMDLSELGQHLSARGIARQKHPERMLLVDALPRTDSGKVHRAAVQRMFH